ncbi:unnamed protein product [Bemisia tabaci]|uniref:C2H2-type domain-containing protein n=1 Tax=Bemisia tabaci TaxID=7038 RepID=A0A9P0A5E0_BEMTA|nr:unnamed protein product [Bemisia tabaci]
MIPCCERNRSFDTLTDLLNHFKELGLKSSIDPVTCKYKFCCRSFTNIRHFKKHFEDVHNEDLLNDKRSLNVSSEACLPLSVNQILNVNVDVSDEMSVQVENSVLVNNVAQMSDLSVPTSSVEESLSLCNDSQGSENLAITLHNLEFVQ